MSAKHPHNTRTQKQILPNEGALNLGQRLRQIIAEDGRTLCFEQALFEIATPALVNEIETLIALTWYLRHYQTTDEERAIGKYLRDSVRPGTELFADLSNDLHELTATRVT